MPCDYKKYPKDWFSRIRPAVLSLADNRCEGSPAYPDCRALNGEQHPVTGSTVVLTIAHRDHDTTHNELSNLACWCQRCHLTYDAKHHAKSAARTRRDKHPQEDWLDVDSSRAEV